MCQAAAWVSQLPRTPDKVFILLGFNDRRVGRQDIKGAARLWATLGASVEFIRPDDGKNGVAEVNWCFTHGFLSLMVFRSLLARYFGD